jgi:hypothetical protein
VSLHLLETKNADNVESDLDDEELKWAGVKAAMEMLNS